jgi:hypothetical protein
VGFTVVQGGSSKMLVDFFNKEKQSNNGGKDGLKVVYFGDHLRNDVQISKTYP